MDKYEIFISYRRQGGQEYARPLALELEKRGYKVFLDLDELKDGKFDKRIMEAIDSAPVFISVLSPHCFDRCVNADDWVRQEIEYAFEREKHIIPVNPNQQFKGFPETTPDKLREAIGQHQFSEIMMGTLFRKSMDMMIEDRIAPILGGHNGQSNSQNFAQEALGQGPFTSVLKVETDLDCRIFVDGKDRGVAKVGDIKYVDLRSGSYRLRFVAVEDSNFVVEEKRFHIDRDTEEWYSVELMPLKKAAEEKKREEERKIQAEADWKTARKYYDEKNCTEAFSLYKKAAEQGHAKAQNMLGWCYQYGEGTTTDKAEAFHWYQKAAEQGYAIAQNNLGYCYQFGIGTATDKGKAISSYHKSAEQGYVYAQTNLGYCYKKGIGSSADRGKAIYWYQKAAEQGHARAQCNLGECYEYCDDKKARYWYQKAADQGYARAQCQLGNLYRFDNGYKTVDTAIYWYQKAANQGYARAFEKMGEIYWNVVHDYKKAEYWFQKALSLYRKDAEKNNIDAFLGLASCYWHGWGGIKQDINQSVYWYRKAAELGSDEGQSNLGSCYLYGHGVPKDEKLGLEWYRKAATQGNSFAQYDIGYFYESGKGVEKDVSQAIYWYRKALDNGYGYARVALRSLLDEQ